jgi:LysR family transcriptional regulator, low CO2-responsive transcriptional regulator
MLNLYKLEIFHAVANRGSFSKAADQLLLSQPAVSQHIRDLEASLQTRLFIRGSRGVQLTPSGEVLLEYTRCILRLLAEAEGAIHQLKDFREASLAIGATPGVGTNLLPAWILAFQERFPGARLSLRTDTTHAILQEILHGRLDLGFVEGEMVPTSPIQVLALREIELFVMVGRQHPWAGQTSVALSDLEGAPFITRPAGSHTRSWIDHFFEANAVTPHIIAEFDRPEAIIAAVSAGMGITILPDWGHATSMERQLTHLTIDGLPLRRTLKLVWSADHPLQAISRAFLSLLLEEFPQLAEVVPPLAPGLSVPDLPAVKNIQRCPDPGTGSLPDEK